MGAAAKSSRTPPGASPARAPTSTISARSPTRRERSTLSITGSIFRAFPPAPERAAKRSGAFTIVSVGRAVEKKGYADLLRALAMLGEDRDWRFEHAGGGALSGAAEGAGGEARHRRSHHLARRAGPRLHLRAAEARRPLRAALAARPLRRPRRASERADGGAGVRRAGAGDRCFGHSRAGHARRRPAGSCRERDPRALAEAMRRLMDDDALRLRLAEAGAKNVREKFSSEPGIDFVAAKLIASRARKKAA